LLVRVSESAAIQPSCGGGEAIYPSQGRDRVDRGGGEDTVYTDHEAECGARGASTCFAGDPTEFIYHPGRHLTVATATILPS
jgi:hypothetical protein